MTTLGGMARFILKKTFTLNNIYRGTSYPRHWIDHLAGDSISDCVIHFTSIRMETNLRST